MKHIITSIFALLFSATSLFADYAAIKSNNVDWNGLVVTVDQNAIVANQPFDLAISDNIANNNSLENIDVFVRFDDIDPGAVVENPPGVFFDTSYHLVLVLEEETLPGVWNPIAETFGRQLEKLGPNGVIIASFVVQTRNTTDAGQPFDINDGFRWFVNENPSERLRVRIIATETIPNGAGSLQSVTLTGAYRLY